MYTTPKKAAASRFRAHPYLSPLVTPLNKLFGFRDAPTVSSPPSPGGPSLPPNSPFDPLSQTPTPRKRYCPPGGDPYSPSPRLVRPKLSHRVGVRDAQSQSALRKQRSFRSLEKTQFNSLPAHRPEAPGFDEISAALEAAKQSSRFPLDKEAEITCNEMGKLSRHRFQATTLTMERERVGRAAERAPRLQTELEERREVRRKLEADLTKERKRLRAMDRSKVQAAKLAKSKPRQERRAERRKREAESESDLSADQSPLVEAMAGLRTSVPLPETPRHRSATPTPAPSAIHPDHAQERAAEAERLRVAAEFQAALQREEARLLALQQERVRAEEEAARYKEEQARIRAHRESQLRREREVLLEEERKNRLRAEQAAQERQQQEEALRAAKEARAREELEAQRRAEERARRMDELEEAYMRQQEDYARIQEAHARAQREAEVLRSSTHQAADILRAQEERITNLAQMEEQFKARFEAIQSALLAQYYAQQQWEEQQQQRSYQHQQQQQNSPPPPTQPDREPSLHDIPMRDASFYVDMDASMHSIPASERPSPPPPAPDRPPTVAERFELYALKWKILKSEKPLVAFEQIPWPVLFDVKDPEEITKELVKEFVMHPERPGCKGKSQKDRVRMDLLTWHPDKCQSRLVEKVPADVQEMTSETVKKIVRFLFELKKN
ncbi:hypothetical protein M413DRAFT_444821 [Hebeloma cylindrosporum]|uniref:Uncharacterized protein n=1 Tax=Hebeloma cylindrosporum TaxID=76867 RepID=A0A0C3CDW1_HEBCY|nr:hypothetical protein M413DRAFT_444821 [Hebeloma cylindrosporum h7]